jgi:hypothetical protein
LFTITFCALDDFPCGGANADFSRNLPAREESADQISSELCNGELPLAVIARALLRSSRSHADARRSIIENRQD